MAFWPLNATFKFQSKDLNSKSIYLNLVRSIFPDYLSDPDFKNTHFFIWFFYKMIETSSFRQDIKGHQGHQKIFIYGGAATRGE